MEWVKTQAERVGGGWAGGVREKSNVHMQKRLEL